MVSLRRHGSNALPQRRRLNEQYLRLAKMIGLIFVLLPCAVLWGAWYAGEYPFASKAMQYLLSSPHSHEDASQNQSLAANRPHHKGLIKLKDLPSNLLPDTGKHKHGGRLVVVGDVHGMKESLLQLLKKINFNKNRDHLILAGDMIRKGPDSAGVVDLAMSLGATGVRGNHEDRILATYAGMLGALEDGGTSLSNPALDDYADPIEEFAMKHRGTHKDRKLVKMLGAKRLKWLQNCPVILRIGNLEGLGRVVVVHAGLVPGIKLEKQDPVEVMNIRTIGKDGVPSHEHDGAPWSKFWNRYQETLPKKERTTVIFAHDSKRGLQKGKYSYGIDTGCLKGGKLTAVVIEGRHADHKIELVHVNCKDGSED